jgi:hypothetical protein
MLAGIGTLFLVLAVYGFFFTWGLSIEWIDILLGAGFVLLVAQFVEIRKAPLGAATCKEESHGV